MRDNDSKFSLKKWKRFIEERNSSDSGDTQIITSLFLMPILFFIIISAVDMGLYFNSMALINSAARDATRTAVIYSGAGNYDQVSQSEFAYGGSSSNVNKEALSGLTGATGVRATNSVEYGLINDLLGINTALVHLHSVNCGPDFINQVGEIAYCDVEWSYDGLPVSAWGMMMSNRDTQFATATSQSDSTVGVNNDLIRNRG